MAKMMRPKEETFPVFLTRAEMLSINTLILQKNRELAAVENDPHAPSDQKALATFLRRALLSACEKFTNVVNPPKLDGEIG